MVLPEVSWQLRRSEGHHMSAAATKRKLLEQAHLLVKTNDPATTFIACAALLDALGTLLSECTGEVVRVRMTAEGQPDSLDMSKQPRRHGIDCEKAEHSREGYLHAEDDDTPYLVDGASYCGRCHKALYAALPASPPVGEPVGKRAEPVKCRHKGKINSGYDSGWDMTWCDDCGQITWCSDGIVSEKQSKRTDRQDWCKSHVLAFGCAKEARGGGLCQSWCGNGDCAVSLATPVPEAGASGVLGEPEEITKWRTAYGPADVDPASSLRLEPVAADEGSALARDASPPE